MSEPYGGTDFIVTGYASDEGTDISGTAESCASEWHSRMAGTCVRATVPFTRTKLSAVPEILRSPKRLHERFCTNRR